MDTNPSLPELARQIEALTQASRTTLAEAQQIRVETANTRKLIQTAREELQAKNEALHRAVAGRSGAGGVTQEPAPRHEQPIVPGGGGGGKNKARRSHPRAF